MQLLVLLSLFACAFGARYQCNYKSAQLVLKRPTYEFSVKLLAKVAESTDGHFVFSPISTWLQLLSLAEGAHGLTFKEIWNVTKLHRRKCFRRKWRGILNRVDSNLEGFSTRKSFIIGDILMKIKKPYVREIEMLKSMEVLLLDFNYPVTSAGIANKHVESASNGVIQYAFTPDDFNTTGLLMGDTSYYKNVWNIPFNKAKPEAFYSEYREVVGEVNMMSRIDYFNYTEINSIGAKVLELPCGSDNKVSMLFFLPTRGSIRDLFFNLQRIRLMSIFNKFKRSTPRVVDVKIPRFKITTDIDNIPELIYDMGVKRVFHPDLANLRGISDYKVYASLMTQVADIEVNEEGVVAASLIANSLVEWSKTDETFTANRPFAFILADKKADIILYSGMYSSPKKY